MKEVFPFPYNGWNDTKSEESLTRIFLNGMGAVLMAAQAHDLDNHSYFDMGMFVVDM